MLDGEVVEDPDDNVDTSCGCFYCNTGEDTEPVLIDFRVRNETNTNTRMRMTLLVKMRTFLTIFIKLLSC